MSQSDIAEKVPEEVQLVINSVISDSEVSPYGLNPPSTSSVWNLKDNDYFFSISMSRGNVYSNYVFTGHEDKVRLTTYDISGGEGTYAGNIIAMRNGNVYVGQGDINRGGRSDIIAENLKASDKLYFFFSVNDGKKALLDEEGSYLTMYPYS